MLKTDLKHACNMYQNNGSKVFDFLNGHNTNFIFLNDLLQYKEDSIDKQKTLSYSLRKAHIHQGAKQTNH